MTGKLTLIACAILACSLIGCDLTLGPITKTTAVVVKPGTGIECLKNVTVPGRLLAQKDGEYAEIRQDIGGWIMLHPDHWESTKTTIQKLRDAYRMQKLKHNEVLTREELDLLGEPRK